MAPDTTDNMAINALTSRWYACRDAARLHLGPGYPARMSELGRTLLNAASAANCDVLQAACAAARTAEALDAMHWFAAAVELVEPSA